MQQNKKNALTSTSTSRSQNLAGVLTKHLWYRIDMQNHYVTRLQGIRRQRGSVQVHANLPCAWLLDVEPGEKVTWKALDRTHLRLVRISTVGSARIGVSCRGLSPLELDIHDTLCDFS